MTDHDDSSPATTHSSSMTWGTRTFLLALALAAIGAVTFIALWSSSAGAAGDCGGG
jgi:hypothetical protein